MLLSDGQKGTCTSQYSFLQSQVKMYAALSFGEVTFYFVTWILSVLYAVYKLVGNFNELFPFRNTGWTLASALTYTDFYDHEWTIWVKFSLFMSPWLISHFIGSELVRRNNRELLPVWHVLISTIFLLNFLGAFVTALVLVLVLLLFLCIFLRSRLLIWIVAMAILIFFQFTETVHLLPLDNKSQYLLFIAGAWIVLRGISYGVDYLDADGPWQRPSPVDYIHCLSYCLYLPVLFLGPVIIYKDYKDGLNQTFKPWTFTRAVMAVVNILRYIFWAVITQLLIFYVDFHYLEHYPQTIKTFYNWPLYGYGYVMGQYFMLKYTVFYGLATAVARLEQINAPPHPKCIARIHLYSHMWKYFDRGLYFFLVKYIYVPCLGKSPPYWRRFSASLVCFFFIYIWHTMRWAVFIWTVMNFIGVTLEGIGKLIVSQAAYGQWESSILSPRGIRRFHALLGTPLFIFSALSNFYFLGSYEIGTTFVERLQHDMFNNLNNLYLFAFCYCCSQVSIEVNNWEQKRVEMKKTKES